MSNYKMNTKCVQGGYTPGNGEPRQIPIIQSTTFKYATSEDMGKLFDLEARNVKINITDSILNISRNGPHIDSPFVDLLKNETVMLKSPKIRRYAIS